LLDIGNQVEQFALLSKGQRTKHNGQISCMGFVDDLAKMAGGTTAQKSFYALN
jgi:hypothetical protein